MNEKAKYEITVPIASTVGLLLGTGWALTWARLESETLPSQSILAALPRTYFLQVSIQSTLSPLVLSVFLGGGWLWLYLRRYPSKKSAAIWRWFLFGLVLAAASWLVATHVNSASSRGGGRYVEWELGACTTVVVVATFWGWLSYSYVGYRYQADSPKGLDLLRPLAGFTIVLCFFAAGLLRVVDARFASDVLPLAKVVVATPCSGLTNGRPVAPNPSQVRDGAAASGPAVESRCEIGGYYLGESSNWIYLIQRADYCIKDPSVPLLLNVRREEAQEVVVFEENKPPCEKQGGS